MDDLERLVTNLTQGYDLGSFEGKDDLTVLVTKVENFGDLFHFLGLTDLVPNLTWETYLVMLKINGIHQSYCLEPLSETYKVGLRNHFRFLKSATLTILVDGLERLCGDDPDDLTAGQRYLLERVKTYEDLFDLLDDIHGLDSMAPADIFDLMLALFDSRAEFNLSRGFSELYRTALSELESIGD